MTAQSPSEAVLRPHFPVQVAGVASLAEAAMLLSCGVDWLGFPLRLAVHTPDTTEEEAREIIAAVGARVRCVVITYLSRAAEIADFCRFLGVASVQLHGDVSVSEIRALRRLRPDLFVIKSLIVGRDGLAELQEAALAVCPHVDAFITDSFDPVTAACGATGRTHDWAVSRALAEALPRPLILAGGLRPGNVAEGIVAVRPAGVDVHTGVEDASGAKDEALVRAFVRAARRAVGPQEASGGGVSPFPAPFPSGGNGVD